MKNFKKRFLSSVVALAMVLSSFSFTALAEEAEITKVYADSFGIDILYAEAPTSIPEVTVTAMDGTPVEITTAINEAANAVAVTFEEGIELDTFYTLTVGETKKYIKVNTVIDEDFENFTYRETDPEVLPTDNKLIYDNKVYLEGGSVVTAKEEFRASQDDKKLLLHNNAGIFTQPGAELSLDTTISAEVNLYLNGASYWGEPNLFRRNTSGENPYIKAFFYHTGLIKRVWNSEGTDITATINGTVNSQQLDGADTAAILFKGEAANNTIALNGEVNGNVLVAYAEETTVTTTNADVAAALAAEGYVVEEADGVYTVAGLPTSITVVGTEASVYLAEEAATAYVVTYAADGTLAGVELKTLTNGANEAFEIGEANAIFVWDADSVALAAWRK